MDNNKKVIPVYQKNIRNQKVIPVHQNNFTKQISCAIIDLEVILC